LIVQPAATGVFWIVAPLSPQKLLTQGVVIPLYVAQFVVTSMT
jgi:hypothetical protein